MSRIKLLPENTINRIAAGEVVERPASVLKELLENSLDSGADQIDIEILSGGRKLIRVTDNGCGMDEEDLFLCLERHATSKITADSDLMTIGTLGFRGEALPSIGAVSRLSITSATETGQGHALKISGGRLEGLEPSPANRGTIIEVADLFYNVPARRKFLKSEQTESTHLLDIAQRYALSRDGLRLTYREGARELLSVSAQHDFRTRVSKIMGAATARDLTPFEVKNDFLHIKGWLGNPSTAARSSSGLFLYVLGRPVRDRLLTRALAKGYGRMLPQGRWPAAIIFIDLNPTEVDVNVHPAKAEVRFRQPDLVFRHLSEAVEQTVGQAPLGAHLDIETEFSAKPRNYIDYPTSKTARPLEEAPQSPPPSETAKAFHHKAGSADNQTESAAGFTLPWMVDEPQPRYDNPAEQAVTGRPFSAQPFPDETLLDESIRPLAQLYDSYILAQGPAGLYIIDQHAAQERILYNQLKERLAREGLPGQQIMFPESFELPPHQVLAAEKLAPHLNRLGFELAPFGGQTFLLKSAPAILKGRDPWPTMLEILSQSQSHLKAMEGAGLTEALESLANSWLYSLACRAAIKAGQKLSLEEMTQLLDDMAEAQNGGYCPHGRPAVFILNRHYIEKKFDRR